MKSWLAGLCAAGGVAFASLPAQALPVLQLFIENATGFSSASDPDDPETWFEVGTDSFRLWVVADTTSPSTGPMYDARFVASFDNGLTPNLAFTPSTTGGAGGFTDPSIPGGVGGPSAVTVDDGHPVLAPHGQFGDGRSWVEYNLGDFTLADSPIADFQPENLSPPFWDATGAYPAPTAHLGQINVYDVLVSGLTEGARVHFDVYAFFSETNRACSGPDTTNCPNAPFSHDARWEQAGATDVAAPGALGLMGLALLALGVRRRR